MKNQKKLSKNKKNVAKYPTSRLRCATWLNIASIMGVQITATAAAVSMQLDKACLARPATPLAAC